MHIYIVGWISSWLGPYTNKHMYVLVDVLETPRSQLGTSGLCQFFSRICYLALPLFLPYYAQYYVQLCRQKSIIIITLTLYMNLRSCLVVIIIIVTLHTILCSPLKVLFCFGPTVLFKMENTLSEAAEASTFY